MLASPFVAAVLKYWKAGLFGLLLLALAIQTVRLGAANNRADRIQVNLNECRQGRIDDRKAYEEAQRKAREQMLADNARIEAEQQRKTDELQSRYERDLARVRSGGVRKDLAAPKGDTGQGGASGVPQAACRDDAENLCVSRSLVVRAAEIELARNALIDWINAQLGIKR